MAGGNSFYERWIAPIQPQMMRTIWRIVRHPDDAKDCLQDALSLVWKRQDRIRSHPNPTALILKICIDVSYDHLRKRFRMQPAEQDTFSGLPMDDFIHPLDTMCDRDREETVQRTIARLSRQQAAAVVMRIVQECSYREIAEALDCSEATARIHVSRGRAQLSEWLQWMNDDRQKEACS